MPVWRSASLLPSGEHLKELIYKRAYFLLSKFLWHCFKCHTTAVARAGHPCTLMTGTVSASPAWGNPTLRLHSLRQLLSLREHEFCLFAFADSFLFRELLCPSHPPVFFLPGTCEEKTAGQRHSASGYELSPQRETSPVLFSCPDQRPFAGVSVMVSFCGLEDDPLEDSMSLVASDTEE